MQMCDVYLKGLAQLCIGKEMMGRQNVCNSLKPALSTRRVCGQIHHNGLTVCLYSLKEKIEDVSLKDGEHGSSFYLRCIGAGQYLVGLAGGIGAFSD